MRLAPHVFDDVAAWVSEGLGVDVAHLTLEDHPKEELAAVVRIDPAAMPPSPERVSLLVPPAAVKAAVELRCHVQLGRACGGPNGPVVFYCHELRPCPDAEHEAAYARRTLPDAEVPS